MDILILGGGGREHALAWAVAKSPDCDRLVCAPGNAGIEAVAECVPLPIEDGAAIATYCLTEGIDFVIVGPEAPLAAGVADAVHDAGVAVFGASREAARLEASKAFTKEICDAAMAPTAAYARFDEAEPAKAYVRAKGAPIVVKADGLAAGKGVIVAETVEAAEAAIDDMLGGAFGAAGAEVVIEEFMTGEEASFFVLCDGTTALPLATAQDHKRAYDGDEGPNTGGMGAYSPAPVMTEELARRTFDEIIEPTMRGMAEMGCPFKGVLYAGLMLTDTGPKLIEYNVRFGDPECQVLMPRLESDLLDLLEAAATGHLAGRSARWSEETALTVVLAARGYPGAAIRGGTIDNLDLAESGGATVFQAGTALRDGRLVASGGRVLNVTALGSSVTEAQANAYLAVDRIDWADGFCRRDIGWREIAREQS